jgi:hypothetical protein
MKRITDVIKKVSRLKNPMKAIICIKLIVLLYFTLGRIQFISIIPRISMVSFKSSPKMAEGSGPTGYPSSGRRMENRNELSKKSERGLDLEVLTGNYISAGLGEQ